MAERLDKALVSRGIVSGRDRAKEEIAAGNVTVNGRTVTKAGTSVEESDNIACSSKQRFVSRGGEKLAAAVQAFSPSIQGKICMDVGASTGGFTDCMLQNGAKYVYAVDVGTDQLAEALRQDLRVCSMEQQNIRHLAEEKLSVGLPEFVASDVSFISLQLVLPHIYRLSAPEAEVVCLIKPQFEAGKAHLNKHGVVTDPKVRQKVCEQIRDFAKELGFLVEACIQSPVLGPEGNVEFLLYLKKTRPFRVMFVPNMSKPGIQGVIPDVMHTLHQLGYQVVTTQAYDALEGYAYEMGDIQALLPTCDVMLVAGGDGTIIEYSRAAALAGKPILGINAGRLGFLSGLEPEALGELARLRTGDYTTEHRRFLQVVHQKKDGTESKYLALNDVVVSNGILSSMVDIELCCNGASVNSYRADGIIVSSPTGSTAYALAAGGPIIHPEIDCYSVTPICPHSLANRAILFPAGSSVDIKMGSANRHPMFVTCDGVDSAPFDAGDTLTVYLSETAVNLLNLSKTAFYERINEKFR